MKKSAAYWLSVALVFGQSHVAAPIASGADATIWSFLGIPQGIREGQWSAGEPQW